MLMIEEPYKKDVSTRKRLNPRRESKLCKLMGKWFEGRNPRTVEKKEIKMMLDLQCKDTKYSEAEIDCALRKYRDDSKRVS